MFELCKIKYLSNNVGSFTSSLMHEYLCANVFTRVLRDLVLYGLFVWGLYEEKKRYYDGGLLKYCTPL